MNDGRSIREVPSGLCFPAPAPGALRANIRNKQPPQGAGRLYFRKSCRRQPFEGREGRAGKCSRGLSAALLVCAIWQNADFPKNNDRPRRAFQPSGGSVLRKNAHVFIETSLRFLNPWDGFQNQRPVVGEVRPAFDAKMAWKWLVLGALGKVLRRSALCIRVVQNSPGRWPLARRMKRALPRR